ncbi:response regulator transcription factor [Luteolibacter pohnpeiensis]|uniref:Response regulator transcription factor n=1 Tax=Luteolibacter pohnpeiensis TaxID=454153 RepID=A0A934S753_9BACT|nr:response regulator transcription factor [Luteolibacter pohnpeiensis]MBK1880947.1 response regulator transcription factor [Luteolibacter pohnpeiensis]
MKRVFIIDDHPILREGLRRLLESQPGFEICGEASVAAGLTERILQLKPDLLIMDIALPDKSGLELIKDLQSIGSNVPILVFSMHDEMLYAERALRAGAKGYLMKGSGADSLATAIKTVVAGNHYLSQRVSSHILASLSGKRKAGNLPIERLTDRELQIFELIGRGATVARIAEQLHISPKTVEAHRGNMKTKLDLADAARLMREAVIWVELSAG